MASLQLTAALEEIQALKAALDLARKGAASGNVWVAREIEASGNVEYVNVIDGRISDVVPIEYIPDLEQLKKDVKELKRLRIEIGKQNARVAELEQDLLAARDSAAESQRESRLLRLRNGKLTEEAERLRMVNVEVAQRCYVLVTTLQAELATTKEKLQESMHAHQAALDKNDMDARIAAKQLQTMKAQMDQQIADLQVLGPQRDAAIEEKLRVQRAMLEFVEMWPEDAFMPSRMVAYLKVAQRDTGQTLRIELPESPQQQRESKSREPPQPPQPPTTDVAKSVAALASAVGRRDYFAEDELTSPDEPSPQDTVESKQAAAEAAADSKNRNDDEDEDEDDHDHADLQVPVRPVRPSKAKVPTPRVTAAPAAPASSTALFEAVPRPLLASDLLFTLPPTATVSMFGRIPAYLFEPNTDVLRTGPGAAGSTPRDLVAGWGLSGACSDAVLSGVRELASVESSSATAAVALSTMLTTQSAQTTDNLVDQSVMAAWADSCQANLAHAQADLAACKDAEAVATTRLNDARAAEAQAKVAAEAALAARAAAEAEAAAAAAAAAEAIAAGQEPASAPAPAPGKSGASKGGSKRAGGASSRKLPELVDVTPFTRAVEQAEHALSVAVAATRKAVLDVQQGQIMLDQALRVTKQVSVTMAAWQAAVREEMQWLNRVNHVHGVAMDAVGASFRESVAEMEHHRAALPELLMEQERLRMREADVESMFLSCDNDFDLIALRQVNTAVLQSIHRAQLDSVTAMKTHDTRREWLHSYQARLLEQAAARLRSLHADLHCAKVLFEVCQGRLNNLAAAAQTTPFDAGATCTVAEELCALVKSWQGTQLARMLHAALILSAVGEGGTGPMAQSREQELIAECERRLQLLELDKLSEISHLSQTVLDLRLELQLERRMAHGRDTTNTKEMESLTLTAEHSILYLRQQNAALQTAADQVRAAKDAEIKTMKEHYEHRLGALKDMVTALETESDQRRQWISSLQTEAEEAQLSYAALQKRFDDLAKTKSDEISLLHEEIKYEVGIKETNQEWVGALKGEVANLHAELEAARVAAAKAAEIAAQEMRRLRKLLWRRDEVGRRLRTDVFSATMFYVEVMSELAGANVDYNRQLHELGCVHSLGGLVFSKNERIRALATRGIGRCAWNGAVDLAVLGLDARRTWMEWVHRLSDESLGKFGALSDDNMVYHETPAQGIIVDAQQLQFQDQAAQIAQVAIEKAKGPMLRRKMSVAIEQRRQGAAVEDVPNDVNQKLIGADDIVMKRLIELLNDADMHVVQQTADAIGILALNDQNRATLTGMQHCIERLVMLCSNESAHVTRNAAAALSNLAFQNPNGAAMISEAGGVEALIFLCHAAMKRGNKTMARIANQQQEPQPSPAPSALDLLPTDGSTSSAGAELSALHSSVGVDVDVLENVTQALATICAMDDEAARRLGRCGGVHVLISLTTAAVTAEHEVIHANAAEALVNCTRLSSEDNGNLIRVAGVAPLVLLCGSKHVSVQRHAALVLGNIAQSDVNRTAVGSAGGVEALFLLAQQEDEEVRANACWALSNLAWDAANQERIGRFFDVLLELCATPVRRVQHLAVLALANALFYQTSNRYRLLDSGRGLPLLLSLCESGDGRVVEHAVRALGSAAALDEIAVAIRELNGIPTVVAVCDSRHANVCKFAAFALANLGLNDNNKRVIGAAGGIDALVRLQAHDSQAVRDQAREAADILGDLARPEELEELRRGFDIRAVIRLMDDVKDVVVGMALDAVVDEIDKKGRDMQVAFAEGGGLQKLASMVEVRLMGANALYEREGDDLGPADMVLVRALWTVRATIHENPENQAAWGSAGITMLLRVLYLPWQEAQEASMACLSSLVSNNQANCRMIMRSTAGLEGLIAVAERRSPGSAVPMQSAKASSRTKRSSIVDRSGSNAALAVELLKTIGPFNWIECANCGFREAGGRFCSKCGHRTGFLMTQS